MQTRETLPTLSENPGAATEKNWNPEIYGTPVRYGSLSISCYTFGKSRPVYLVAGSGDNRDGRVACLILRGKASKPIAHYVFDTEEKREACIVRVMAEEARRVAAIEERKAKRSQAKEVANPFKVGDVLYRTWGYDQTNVDFLEVVEVLPKSVKARPIADTVVEDSFMAGQATPVRGDFRGDAKVLRLNVNIYGDAPRVSGAGGFWPLDRPSVRCSWYA